MERFRRIILIVSPLAAAAVVMIGVLVSRAGESGSSAPASTSTDLLSFRDFPVFWVGDDWNGHKLDRVIGPHPDGWSQPMVLTYGDCGDAFERGCVPPLVIKTIPRCWPGIEVETMRLRGRAASQSPNLTVEAAFGTVVVYADEATSPMAARDLTVANVAAYLQYSEIRPGDDLPGSLCEYGRLHPHAFPTPATPDSYTPDPRAATVFAAFDPFGGGGLARTYEEARERLGYLPLRSDDPRFTVAQEGAIGSYRTFRSPLPTFEQMYHMVRREAPIHVRQEPESDSDFPRQHTMTARIRAWDVELYEDYGDVGAVFFSGASIDGQRVRVVLYASTEYGFTLNDIRLFVSTLHDG